MQQIAANADLRAYDYGGGSEGEQGEYVSLSKPLELIGHQSSEVKRKGRKNHAEDEGNNPAARITPLELRKGAKSPIEAPSKRTT